MHLFGSGPLMNEALRAQEILREKFSVAADVWSVTSYTELYRDALSCSRWNKLHPDQKARLPHVARVLKDEPWPIVAVTDYVKTVPSRVAPWTPAGLYALGTDGFGRSDTREALRRFFEIDAENVAYAALWELSKRSQFDRKKLPAAMQELGIDPEAPDPAFA
ncbi:MAG: hypothetical protein HRF50_08180 [Phycisphaerae bacterium]